MVKSGWVEICIKVVKVLNLEERKPQLLIFWFYGNVVSVGSVSDQKSYVPEDLVKVTCKT